MTAVDLLAGLGLEDERRWGEAAEPWQWDDARSILDPSGPRRHYLTRPRGASKTGDLGGVAIAVLLDQAPPTSRSYGFAADKDQAGLLLDSIAGFLSRTSEVGGALKLDSWKLTNTRTGATFEVMASDDASAWGLRPYFVVVDEFAQWKTTPGPRRLWRAIFSALPKVSDSRLVILTSAGDPVHWSHKILETAEQNVSWRVNQVPGPCPWISAEDLKEQQDLLPDWEYRRLHLNEWLAADDRLTTVDDIRVCVTLDGPQPARSGVRYVIGLDVGLKRDRTVATVCHLDREGDTSTVILDRQQTWAGTRNNPVQIATVEGWLLEAHRTYNRAAVVLDPWQAVHLAQRLRGERIRVQEFIFSAASVGRLALTLYRLLRDHQLALYDEPDLLDELANVRLIETTPGSYRIDHDPDKHDDRAISLALAAQRLLATSGKPRADSRRLAAALAATSRELYKPGIGSVGY